MAFVRDHKGSVSAEHGVGLQKSKYLNYSKSDDMIRIMQQIKGVFDPKGIMNPYKLFNWVSLKTAADFVNRAERLEAEILTNSSIQRFWAKN